MTQPDKSDTELSDDAQRVLYWLLGEVAEQGTGRRLGKIQMAMGWYLEDEPRVGAAVRELVASGDVRLEDALLGVYVCPNVE